MLSCEGWHIVTVEGLGSTKDGLHPIQERLAAFHGTQVFGEFLSLLDYSLMRKKTEKSMSWPFYNPLWSFFGQLH